MMEMMVVEMIEVTEMTGVMAVMVGFSCWVGHLEDGGMVGFVDVWVYFCRCCFCLFCW